jgi:hypothetical protein
MTSKRRTAAVLSYKLSLYLTTADKISAALCYCCYIQLKSPEGITVRIKRGSKRDPVTVVAFGTNDAKKASVSTTLSSTLDITIMHSSSAATSTQLRVRDYARYLYSMCCQLHCLNTMYWLYL